MLALSLFLKAVSGLSSHRPSLSCSHYRVKALAAPSLFVLGSLGDSRSCFNPPFQNLAPHVASTQVKALAGGLRRGLQYDPLVRSLLVRFLTKFLGGELCLLLARNLQLSFSVTELAFLYIQNHRIFARMPSALVSPRQVQEYSWRFGAVALYLGVTLRDPALVLMWVQDRLRYMSLFQHRRFFRTLAVSLKTAVSAPQLRYRLSGLHLQVTGKLSVTGNAMSRTYFLRTGPQANSSLNLRLARGFSLVRTKTGCLGLWLSFFF